MKGRGKDVDLEDLKRDLSRRIGKRVSAITTREGEPVHDLTDLYPPSPAGFSGQVVLVRFSRHSWELWQEAEAMWNFQSKHINWATMSYFGCIFSSSSKLIKPAQVFRDYSLLSSSVFRFIHSLVVPRCHFNAAVWSSYPSTEFHPGHCLKFATPTQTIF